MKVKNFILMFILMISVSGVGFCQSGVISNIALGQATNGYTKVLANAAVAVCVYVDGLQSCTSSITVYSDQAMTVPVTRMVSDSNGNIGPWFVPSGTYLVTINAAGYTSQNFVIVTGNDAYFANELTGVQSAIADAQAAGLHKVVIPEGTYPGEVTIPSGFDIECVSRKAVLTLANGTNGNVITIPIGAENVTIRNCSIDGNASGQTSESYALAAPGLVSGLRIENVAIQNGYSDCIFIGDTGTGVFADGFSLSDSIVQNCGSNGLTLWSINNVTIKNNTFANWGKTVAYSDAVAAASIDTGTGTTPIPANNYLILGNTFTNVSATKFSIELFNGGVPANQFNGVVITNNIFDGGSTGMNGLSINVKNSSIIGNTFKNGNSYNMCSGICELIGSGNTVSGNTIEGGIIGLTGDSEGGVNNVISANRVSDGSANARLITLANESSSLSGVVVSDNVLDVRGATGACAAVYVGTSGSNQTVSGLSLRDNTMIGDGACGAAIESHVADASSGWSIAGNRVSGFGSLFMSFANPSTGVTDVLISDNSLANTSHLLSPSSTATYAPRIWNNLASSSDVVQTLNGGVTIDASGNVTATKVTAGSINGTMNLASCGASSAPGWCSGSTMDAWMQAAWTYCTNLGAASCPLYVPGGSYTWASPLVIGATGPKLQLTCDKGRDVTTLHYTGTSGTMLTLQNQSFIEGCTFTGVNASSTSRGIQLGDTSGHSVINSSFRDIQIKGFGDYGLVLGTNVYIDQWLNNSVRDNGPVTTTGARNLLVLSGATNMGENLHFSGGEFTAAAGPTTIFSKDCISVQSSAVLHMDSVSLDQCGFALNANGATFMGNQVHMEDNSNGTSAAAGIVGEVKSASVSADSGVTLTTATPANVLSMSLSAGDWEVSGRCNYSLSSVTISGGSLWVGGISNTSATLPSDYLRTFIYGPTLTTGSPSLSAVITPWPFNSSSSQTIYLVCEATFTAGTVKAYGSLEARRMR